MKKILVVTLFALGCTIQAEENYGDVASRVVRILEVEHYSQKVFDDELSSKTLAGYLELLDPQKIYFTSEDIELFTGKFATTIDDSVKQGQIPAAGEIYQIYRQRVRDRLAFAEQVLAEDTITFDSDRSVPINRKATRNPGKDQKLGWLRDHGHGVSSIMTPYYHVGHESHPTGIKEKIIRPTRVRRVPPIPGNNLNNSKIPIPS